VNAILAIPFALRLGILFVLGTLVAGGLNLGIYRLAWRPRSISPWSASPLAGGRTWLDRLPYVGWWRLRRESAEHGRGFWIRPLVVELGMGLAFAGLYAWEIGELGLYGLVQPGPPPAQAFVATDFQAVLHAQFLGHLLLLCFMVVASLIDLDEQTIPDSLTVPGTLAGLAIITSYPWSLLPAETWLANGIAAVEFLSLASPGPWPDWLGGFPHVAGCAIALACWTLWCTGMMPRRWNVRRGWRTAARVFFHRLLVERVTYGLGLLWLVGSAFVCGMAWRGGAANWAALLTGLVGMAVGGGLIWIVRVIGHAALAREAMGFGDVTLMSMIGVYVGWQGALVVFFLAPCLGLASGLVRWTLHRENEIPYGPYLCLATGVLIVAWPGIWDAGRDFFELGSLLAALLALCFVLMGILLKVYALARGAWAGRR
jgi:leader peptidase (prepilin peptidase) / N-methyltransferase